MNNDRRLLSWLAILVSLLCCAPAACGAGFLVLAGGVSYFDPEHYWEVSDTFLFTVLGFVGLIALVAGILLAMWGVRSLLERDVSSNPEANTQEAL